MALGNPVSPYRGFLGTPDLSADKVIFSESGFRSWIEIGHIYMQETSFSSGPYQEGEMIQEYMTHFPWFGEEFQLPTHRHLTKILESIFLGYIKSFPSLSDHTRI